MYEIMLDNIILKLKYLYIYSNIYIFARKYDAMKRLIILILLFCLASCYTKREIQEVPVCITKTEFVSKIKYDSIYIHDSIDKFFKNDTLTIIKYKSQYKLQLLHDTLCIRDTIPVTIKNTEFIEKQNPINKYLLIFSIVSIVYFIFKIRNLFI